MPEMNFSKVPVGLLIIAAIIGTLLFIEIGYRLGKKIYLKQVHEKNEVTSSVTGYILALIAFIMAFTFSIVSGRYDTKKALVREETNTIRTAWFRSDFLPDTDRVEAKKLFLEYVEVRLGGLETKTEKGIIESLKQCDKIQQALWHMAVINGHKDLNSDVAALYIESLNDMVNVHENRVIVSLYSRVPMGIWFILLTMVALGMMVVGYMSAISGSSRSWAWVILAVSFALVIGMIYTMDKLYSPFTPISQFPMEQLLEFMKSN
jgi:FtsH-binding integral membrane protein